MSEQTPDTNGGLADGQDPSMEDILASIRKIIAEDDSADVSAGDDIFTEPKLETIESPSESGDIASLAHKDTLDLDILADEENLADPDVEALIGDMDEAGEDSMSLAPAAAELSASAPSDADAQLDDILTLEIPMDEEEASPVSEANAMDENIDLTVDLTVNEPADADLTLDDEIADMLAVADETPDDEIITRVEDHASAEDKPQTRGFMDGAMAALGLGGAAAMAAKSTASDAVEPPKDDLSLMLDNMLEDSSFYQDEVEASDAPDEALDSAEDLLAEIQETEIEEPEIQAEEIELETVEVAPKSETDPDMDLVKSLMADLTEEPLHDEEVSGAFDIEAETEVEAEAEMEAQTEAVSETLDAEQDANSGDVMDEILSMTLDDETELSEEVMPEENLEASLEPEAAPEPMSLKDIAAAAKADAQSSDNTFGAGLAAAAGVGVIGAALTQSQEDAPETEDASETEDAPETEDASEAVDAETITETIETPIQENITEETPTMATANKRTAKASDAIIDEVTETATVGAFASLTNIVEEKATVAERGDRIGDLVMEALQPMLKEWLDKNLKGIVERAVTKEVKRISSGK